MSEALPLATPSPLVAPSTGAADPWIASPIRRLGAFLVDSSLFLGVIGGGQGFLDAAAATLGIDAPLPATLTLGVIPMGLLQLFLLGRQGQTLGTLAMQIRIVDKKGNNPGLLRAWMAREFARKISSVVPVVGLTLWTSLHLLIFRRDRRAFHDILADTFVVDARDPATVAARPSAARLSEVCEGGAGFDSEPATVFVLLAAVGFMVLCMGVELLLFAVELRTGGGLEAGR